MLLAGLFSSLSSLNTPATRQFTHSLTWGINLALFTNMVQYLNKKCHGKGKGPVYLLAFAIFCVMFDLTRHLLNDSWGNHCDSVDDLAVQNSTKTTLIKLLQEVDREAHQQATEMEASWSYKSVCYVTGFASMYDKDEKLTRFGFFSSIVMTWTGFVLLYTALLWGIGFFERFRAQWRALQRRRRETTGEELLARV